MLKVEQYLKTVKRPYPVLFTSLVCRDYANEDNYKGILNETFSIKDMAHVDDVWYYGKDNMIKGGELALRDWQDLEKLNFVKKEFERREVNLISSSTDDFKAFVENYGKYMPALALIFAVDNPVTIELQNVLNSKLSSEEVENLISELNIPLEDNYHKLEELELVTTNDIYQHVKKWEFLYARYGERSKYTVEEAKSRLAEIDKKEYLENRDREKKRLKEKIDYAKDILGERSTLVDLFQYVIFYRTQRTDVMNRSAFLAIPMLEGKAKELGVTYEELLECSVNEVLSENIPDKDILEKRKKDCSTILEDGKTVKCLVGKGSEELIKFFEGNVEETTELKGQVACKGNIQGTVRVINNKGDFWKMKEGEILVTSMTTPDFIPVMKIASAFITDEGGVTCHAAIIAREMKKPCIIGTNNATKVLKDGMEVEVDANTGVIKILEK